MPTNAQHALHAALGHPQEPLVSRGRPCSRTGCAGAAWIGGATRASTHIAWFGLPATQRWRRQLERALPDRSAVELNRHPVRRVDRALVRTIDPDASGIVDP